MTTNTRTEIIKTAGVVAMFVAVMALLGSIVHAQTTVPAVGTVTGFVLGGPNASQVSETIFLDANNNGAINPGEYSTTVKPDGSFTFAGVKPGAYIARQVLPAGYAQVTPVTPKGAATYGVHFNAAAGKTVFIANFVDVATPTVSTPAVSFPVVLAKLTFAQSPLPPAPSTIHLHSLASFTDDWRNHATRITVTAPDGSTVWNEPSPMCAFAAPAAGTYTVTTTIDGNPTVSTCTVAAAPQALVYFDSAAGSDANAGSIDAPKKTFSGLQLKSNTAYLLKRGCTFAVTSKIAFDNTTNARVDRYGDPTQPLPIVNWTVHGGPATTIFSTWENSSNYTIANIFATSLAKPAVNDQGRAYRAGAAMLVHCRGNNATISGVQFDCLNRLVEGDGVAGLLVQGCVQTTDDGITSQCIYISNATDLVMVGNVLLDAATESTVRCTSGAQAGTGGIVRGLRAHNKIGRASGTSKATITDRMADTLHSYGNVVTGAGYASDKPDTGPGGSKSCLFEDEACSDAAVEIKTGPVGNVYRRFSVSVKTGPAIKYSAPQGSANVLEDFAVNIAALAPSAPDANVGISFSTPDTTAKVTGLKVTGVAGLKIVSHAPAGWSALNASVVTAGN